MVVEEEIQKENSIERNRSIGQMFLEGYQEKEYVFEWMENYMDRFALERLKFLEKY